MSMPECTNRIEVKRLFIMIVFADYHTYSVTQGENVTRFHPIKNEIKIYAITEIY